MRFCSNRKFGTLLVVCQKLVHYICMLWTGRFVLNGSVLMTNWAWIWQHMRDTKLLVIFIPAEMYHQPFYHHHHISSSVSHGTLRPHCSTFVGPMQPQAAKQAQMAHTAQSNQPPPNGKNQSLTLSASMLSNGNGSKSDLMQLRSSADNLIKQHQMVCFEYGFN